MRRRTLLACPLALAVEACGGDHVSTQPNSTSTTVTPFPSETPPVTTDAEGWRPRFHYTPQRHWMNDPNGLVHLDGRYHLYYQYNPEGNQWGNISWGHAVSTDLVRWHEQPVAIPATERLMAFSGSTVVDVDNTSGFAAAGSSRPAIVAVFTGFDPVTKIQAQHVAYSLDGGQTYAPYAGNPVIDIGSTEFRDPKVFWHAPTRRWVMLVVAALEQAVWIYTSPNLTSWTKASTFGPAGSAAGNIWEVPDLFELAIDGNRATTRWVLIVSVNHGSLWGGSGVQYFIGDFDGTRFAADDSGTIDAVTRPAGDLVADFEDGRIPSGWQVTGSAFGAGPVAGALPGQQFVSGHLGRGLMNSFHGGDASTGVLISAPFRISRPWLCFQIAGGSSPLTRLELQVDDRVIRQSSGDDTETLKWTSWDVSALIGQQAVLRAVDEATGRWGHLLLDTIVMCDQPVSQPDPARITLWADHGRDFYAPITFSNMPEDRVVWLGWMSNWAYAAAVPTDPWRGQQSLPRQLELTRTPRGLRLRQRVVDEVRALLEPQAHLSLSGLRGSELAALIAEAAPIGRRLMARFAVPVKGLKSPVGIELLKGAEAVRLGYDPEKNTFFVDRTTKQPKFSGQSERHDAERLVDDEDVVLEVWIDGSTLELFADGGTVVISDLVYADHAAVGVSVFYGPEDPIVQTFEVQAVSPAA